MGRSLVDIGLTPPFAACVAFDPTKVASIDSTTDFSTVHQDWQMVGLRVDEGLSRLFRAELWMARKEGIRPPPPGKPQDFWDRTGDRINDVDAANQNAANMWKNVQNAANQDPRTMPGGPAAYGNQLAQQIGNYTGAATGLGSTALDRGQKEAGDALDSFNPNKIRQQVLGEGLPVDAWNGTRPPNPAEFLGTMRSIRLWRDGSLVLPHGRWITGLVYEFEDLGILANGWRVVRLSLAPQLWKLSLRKNCRLFSDKTALEILDAVLKDAQVYPLGANISARITRVLPKREYCVQYDETDLDFVGRLLAQEGLLYGFEHHERCEQLCIYDGADIDGDDLNGIDHQTVRAELPLTVDPPRRDNEEVCFDLSQRVAVVSTRTRERAVNISVPRKLIEQQQPKETETLPDRSVDERDHAAQAGELERYPGDLAFTGDGDAGYLEFDPQRPAAQIRLQRTLMDARALRGSSNATAMLPGQRANITGSLDGATYHPNADAAGQLRVLSVRHLVLRDEDDRLGGIRAALVQGIPAEVVGAGNYVNHFEAYPAALPVRLAGPPRPRIEGLQTAIVVSTGGASTDQPSNLCLDAMGRVLVRFYWDRRLSPHDWMNAGDVHACWVRVAQPWAGAGWGTSFHPRVGMEVAIAFEDGDPDRPVVVGAVHNYANPFPRERKHITHEGENVLPLKEDKRLHYKKDATHSNTDDKHLALIRTQSHPPAPSGQRIGYNELSFDDAKDHQRIRWHAEGVLFEEVEHDHSTKVVQDQVNVVQGNQEEHIGGGSDADAGMQILHVKGTRTKEIKGHEHQVVALDRNEHINGQEQIEIEGYRAEKVLQREHVQIGREDPPTGLRDLTVRGSRSTRVHGHDRLEVGKDRILTITHNFKASGSPMKMAARAPAASADAPPASEISTGDGILHMSAKGDPGKLDLIAHGEAAEGSVDLLARNPDGTGDPPAIYMESKGKRVRFEVGDVSMTLSDEGLHLKAPRGVHLRCGDTSLVLGPAGQGTKVAHHNLTFFSVANAGDTPASANENAPEPERADAQVAYFGARSNGMAGEAPKREPLPVPDGYDFSKDRDLSGTDMHAELEQTGIAAASEEDLFAKNGLFVTGKNFAVQAGQLTVLSSKGVNLQETDESGNVVRATRLLSDDEQDLFKKLAQMQQQLNDALLAYKKAEHEYQQSMKDLKKASEDYDKAFAEVSRLTNIYQGLKQKLDEHDRKLAELETKRQKLSQQLEEARKRHDSTDDLDTDYEMTLEAIEDEKNERKRTEDDQKKIGEEFDKAHDKYSRAQDKLDKQQKKTQSAKDAMLAAKKAHEDLRDQLVELKKEINRRTAPRTNG